MSTTIDDPRVTDVLRAGGIAVLRTDTLYGVVARADDERAVERVYRLKHRLPNKSCVILLDTPSAAYGHSTELSQDIAQYAGEPTSFLIPAEQAPHWLLRANDELAYRVPQTASLRALIRRTGPLIAPSANPEGLPPALSISEAVQYFGDAVDVYVDGGSVPSDTRPSRLVRIHPDGSIERLR